MTLGVAIIGSGIFVREEHLPAVLANPSLELKAIYSRTLKSASSLSVPSIPLYSSDSGPGKTYADLLSRSDIDAVIIALPIPSQPEYIKAALTAGKNVLSEKPIAKDVASARELIDFYKELKGKGEKAIWSVGENFRFLDSFEWGRQQVRGLGEVTGFRVKMFTMVEQGGKYIETPWRKVPEYQGGFLLDGGVHFVAGTRLLLGPNSKPESLTAYTTLLQKYLPPVDTVNSIWKTSSGISGTFSVSFGTTLSGGEWTIASEKGSVTVTWNKVTVESGGKIEEKEFKEEGNGVKQEIRAWVEAIEKGVGDVKQGPEEALADLEILEKMLRSGEGDGEKEKLQYQV